MLEVIFSMEQKTGTSHHFGSRLVFHPDGTLFVTTGDRGDGSRAQDFQDHAGAVLRINPDGIDTGRQSVCRRRRRQAGNLVEGPPQPAGRRPSTR